VTVATGGMLGTDVVCQGAPPSLPSGSGPGAPTSGSRKARLRCTGPGGGPIASSTARAASDRHVPDVAGSGGPGSANQRTARP
jgi:hypothetical protein